MPIEEIHASVIIKIDYPEGSHKPNARSVLDVMELIFIGETFGDKVAPRRISEIDFVETGTDSVI